MGRVSTMAHSPSDGSRAKASDEGDGLILTAIMNNDQNYLVELLSQGCSPMGDATSGSTRPLDLAISLENLEVARILLRYGASMKPSVYTTNPTGLHVAVISRQKAVIRQLLKSKVDWSGRDGNGATVLHMVFEVEGPAVEDDDDDEDGAEDDEDEEDQDEGASRSAKVAKLDSDPEQEIIEILTMFLNLGANVNAETSTGETALFLALRKGMIEAAGFLIERGANVQARDNIGNSLIHLLIEDEVREEEASESLAQKNNATFVGWLLSKGLSPDYRNARGETPAQLALEYRLRDTLLVLLRHVNPRHENEEAEGWLHVLVKMYQTIGGQDEFLARDDIHEALRGLLARGAPVNGVDRHGQTLFHAAVGMREPRLLGSMAERFVNVLACNSESETVLHALVSRCIDDDRVHEPAYARIAQLLCAKGARAQRCDKRGFSALHLAAQYRYPNIARVLADAGASPAAATCDGSTLLHLLAATRLADPADPEARADRKLVDLALEHGCDLEATRQPGGWTALHLAASAGNARLVRLLLERGARVDCRSQEGHTPLHLATHGPNPAAIAHLLEMGARSRLRNLGGHSAIHLALLGPRAEALELLLGFGVEPEFHVGFEPLPAVAACLGTHLARLRAAQLPAAERLQRALPMQLPQPSHSYEREVMAMKTHAIDEKLTLYQLLHMQPHLRLEYLASKSLDLLDLEAKFPNYYGFVWRYCWQAKERKTLNEPALAALRRLGNVPALNEFCAQCVFCYLDNECLKNMIDAAKDT